MNNTLMLNMLKQAIMMILMKQNTAGSYSSCMVPRPMLLPRGPEKPTVVAAARNKPIMALGFKMTSFGPGLNGIIFHQP